MIIAKSVYLASASVKGYVRLLTVRKTGSAPMSNNFAGAVNVDFIARSMGGNNVVTGSSRMSLKVYTSEGVGNFSFTTDEALPQDMEIYVEERENEYIVIGRVHSGGARIELEGNESGYVTSHLMEDFTYEPTGILNKAQPRNVRTTPLTSAENQWMMLGSIEFNRRLSNYSALFSMMENGGIQDKSTIRLVSLQGRLGELNQAARVSMEEITKTSVTDRRFETYLKQIVTPTKTRVEIWVNIFASFSAVGFNILTESFTPRVSAVYPLQGAFTATRPAGELVQAVYPPDALPRTLMLPMENGWEPVLGFANPRSTGVTLHNHMATVNFNIVGGDTGHGIDVAMIPPDRCPVSSLETMAIVGQGETAKATRIAVYSSGKIQLRGNIPPGESLSASFSYPII